MAMVDVSFVLESEVLDEVDRLAADRGVERSQLLGDLVELGLVELRMEESSFFGRLAWSLGRLLYG